ncbi:MAG: acyl-[acyl-carrier-protein]--UDP-N-acetylglucosamine O-acyltransferase, partial [Gammaproteobacteria bacterium]|nr:acyl-[acyl-carrier-protein]--UDP-N-acetylglucosamine O-acyltransferase [Gammaproteobacteria bacterium]
MIHPSAIVDPDAIIADGVEIGPYCVIGPGVEIGEETVIGPHVVIRGPTRIGKGNRIFQFSSIGDDPQDKKFQGDSNSRLEIGDGNTIREYCTINRGTDDGGGITRVGDDNWIMAYV